MENTRMNILSFPKLLFYMFLTLNLLICSTWIFSAVDSFLYICFYHYDGFLGSKAFCPSGLALYSNSYELLNGLELVFLIVPLYLMLFVITVLSIRKASFEEDAKSIIKPIVYFLPLVVFVAFLLIQSFNLFPTEEKYAIRLYKIYLESTLKKEDDIKYASIALERKDLCQETNDIYIKINNNDIKFIEMVFPENVLSRVSSSSSLEISQENNWNGDHKNVETYTTKGKFNGTFYTLNSNLFLLKGFSLKKVDDKYQSMQYLRDDTRVQYVAPYFFVSGRTYDLWHFVDGKESPIFSSSSSCVTVLAK